ATHRTGSSCTACHMSDSSSESHGLHTFSPALESCTACHTNMTEIPEEINGYTEEFKALENLLLAKGYIGEDGYVKGPNGENASSTNPLVVSAQDASAIWNYKTLYEDQSHGIHNPTYTRALLKNSIEALQN
ncbi:MAG: hypothetical protein WBN28_07055, partial [Lutimonas sp.]